MADEDRRQLIKGLEHAVTRYGWELATYVVNGHHLHLLVKTSRPNLGAGSRNCSTMSKKSCEGPPS
jgi:hypothetical protein